MTGLELNESGEQDEIAYDRKAHTDRQETTQSGETHVRRKSEGSETRDGRNGAVSDSACRARMKQLRAAVVGNTRSIYQVDATVYADSQKQREHDDIGKVQR